MDKYVIIRSKRKTISIQIDLNGQIVVRCPFNMRQQDISAFVESKSSWIEKHRAKLKQSRMPALSEGEIGRLRILTRDLVTERAAYYAPIMKVSYNRITIRTQKTRWGSCSGKGNLNFNCLLALVPTEVLDYVVVHELAHLKQMNHSAQFWAEVASVLPDYKTRKQWLKENGAAFISRIRE